MKTLYRSKIDWWVWLVVAGALSAIWLSAIDMSWGYVFACAAMTVFFIMPMFGCWYVIDGEELIIYQFFRPTHLPISKIKTVKKTTGYIATAGMSHKRVTIRFADRSVLKSFAPLEISPRDRDGFIGHLRSINPMIEIAES